MSQAIFDGVWSATPTPLRDDLTLDLESVRRMVRHHQKLPVKGLFLAGTCGEGPWLPDADRRELVRTVADEAKGTLKLSVQVTDNSARRILKNIEDAREDGADFAIIAEPFFLINATPENLLRIMKEVTEKSPLPVGLYNRGKNAKVPFPPEVIAELYRMENLVTIKDSTADPAAREEALRARAERNGGIALMNGDEFACADYIKAGYDGLLIGGGIFNALYAQEVINAVRCGEHERAARINAALNELNYAVYGGKSISCWLSGLKYLMVKLGVFSTWASYLNFPLTPECKAAIDRVVEENAVFSLPE